MFKQIIGRLRPIFSVRKSLGLILLLVILLWLQFAHGPETAGGRQNYELFRGDFYFEGTIPFQVDFL